MRRLPLNQPNVTIRRTHDAGALVRLGLLLLCGLTLAGGFIFAAGNHFAAVRYGYRSEELRRERARLLERQAVLLLAHEEAATPVRLEAAARNIGMQQAAPSQIVVVKSDGVVKQASVEKHGGAVIVRPAGDRKTVAPTLPPVAPALIKASATFNR